MSSMSCPCGRGQVTIAPAAGPACRRTNTAARQNRSSLRRSHPPQRLIQPQRPAPLLTQRQHSIKSPLPPRQSSGQPCNDVTSASISIASALQHPTASTSCGRHGRRRRSGDPSVRVIVNSETLVDRLCLQHHDLHSDRIAGSPVMRSSVAPVSALDRIDNRRCPTVEPDIPPMLSRMGSVEAGSDHGPALTRRQART